MSEENIMKVIDEDGNEIEVEILLTFDNDETGKSYVIFQSLDDEDEVYAYSYTEDGNLDAIDDDKEYEMCQEVLNAFIDEDLLDDWK